MINNPAMRRGLLLLAVSLGTGGRATGREARLEPDRYEIGVMPAIAGNSDYGFGFGAVGSLARFSSGHHPYRWRLEALVFLSVKQGPEGVELPYHDDYVKLDLPGLLDGRLRLNIRLGFGRYTNSGYYGVGNASPAHGDSNTRYHQYDRINPQLQLRGRLAILRRLQLMVGSTVTHNWIEPYQPSLLRDDMQRTHDAQLRDLLRGTGEHGVLELDLGWIWDSRDHEHVPTRGMFHEISWRCSPGLAWGADIPYGGVNLTTRFYQALYRDRLVLGARLMVDMLVGHPPFYAMASHGGLFPGGAIGGGTAVRGVPLQRYHGKIKLLGNLELRARLLPFSIRGQRFSLGAVAFVDSGRVWTDFVAMPRFDGEGVGLKLGLGGGLRLQWGETFLIRADVAWSPDADPVGFYVDVGHVF